jgi:hypothetical protein
VVWFRLQGGIVATTDGGTTWATVAVGRPNVIFEFDDGTFGTFQEALAFTIATSSLFNSGTAQASGAGAEFALEFSVPFDTKCCGANIYMAASSVSADFEVHLYSGTSSLASMSVDANQLILLTASGIRVLHAIWAEQTLTRNTTYTIGVKATTANNISVSYIDVASAAHLQAYPGGDEFICNARTGAGAWGTALATRRPMIFPIFSAGGAI